MVDKQEVASSPAVANTGPRPGEGDAELAAIQSMITALRPLTEEARRRVLEYVLGRFGVMPIEAAVPSLAVAALSAPSSTGGDRSGPIQDIRSLKEAKSPKSANEMAALVAFYVSELAPMAERSKTITKSDIERYFKSANFRLPADAGFTLVNAKNAGYLDNAGSGQYKLNPVGYNLVAHRMGERDQKESRRTPMKKVKRPANKKVGGHRKG